MKTLRETLREKNLLNNFLEEQTYRLSKNDSKITIHPLRNYLDVSLLGGWLSQSPLVLWPSTEVLLEVADGKLGLGLLQEAETLGNSGSTQRRRHYHPQLLVLLTGPRNYQVAGKRPFLCQRCVISLREIVPSEQKAIQPTTVLLPGKTQEQRGLVGCSPWGR